ncbi:Serine/threonine-protein kinase [Komagataella phaffii CBS 7435]|uniref:non-specific serine/threonine protein kinase n=2 Tax=Komagataella phaffii TaxID=460519 RepID=C4R4A2_KOMPG|nr:Serine/threonine protein kinase involved in regulation of exocytosis [Komagataella phaffii GS115]AOA63654.1 GQ67_03409T0 [Komagataella phaffii]CAH2449861.1 Serine/threonine-protein kinase [Komagataella phaffii CBS 7435]AOA68719.1 GQ68_03378T0 [Komagataella phaffii GS115]CAY70388.1 Serine/threonine protein kinase involved in regulation of exocytosis [Komagataella phaffii GS115]CCA39819.1 Serine/threonine-protein kinase [Komagataella phaffii CBS 7435]
MDREQGILPQDPFSNSVHVPKLRASSGGQPQKPVIQNSAPATARMLRNASSSTSAALLKELNTHEHSQRQHTPQKQPSLDAPAALVPVESATKQFHRTSIGDWEFSNTIGAGSMGKVKVAKHRVTHEVCAIKIVIRSAKIWQRNHQNDPEPETEEKRKKLRDEYKKELERDERTVREAALGKIMYHPNICRLFECYTMSNHYYMLFEIVQGVQLLDYIVSHGKLKETRVRQFARSIASALDYCHSNNIVHRDLKIENIMINNKGEIKLIDFGLSNMYDRRNLLKTFCGSLYFAAPELLSCRPYIGPEIDVWSFGVVLFVLVSGKVPFDDDSVPKLHAKIKRGKVEYPEFISPLCHSLLSQMLVVNPDHRVTLKAAMEHPWMTLGFAGPPSNYLPQRSPIVLPLDLSVVREIANLGLGNEEQIARDITNLISSREYEACVERWKLDQQKANIKGYSARDDSAIIAFHPLLSTYYLVDEMRKRKLAKGALKGQTSVLDTVKVSPDIPKTPAIPQKLETTDVEQPLLATVPPAYTSPHGQPAELEAMIEPAQPLSSAHPFEMDMTQQQHASRKTHIKHAPERQDRGGYNVHKNNSGGLNSLFRRLSGKRPHKNEAEWEPSSPPPQVHPFSVNDADRTSVRGVSPITQPAAVKNVTSNNSKNYLDPVDDSKLVRRVGSLRITNKEKQQVTSDFPRLPNFTIPEQPPKNAPIPIHAQPTTTGTTFQSNDHEIKKKLQASTSPNEQRGPPTLAPSQQRRLHPTARAKSLGHSRKQSLNFKFGGPANNQLPALPTKENYDVFEDAQITDNNLLNPEGKYSANTNVHIKPMTESQILFEAEHAPPGTMPSVEYPRTLFLKGFFSVQTTSSKPLPVIRYNIIAALCKLNIQFTEVNGGFVCVYRKTENLQIGDIRSPVIESRVTDDTDSDVANSSKLSSSSTANTRVNVIEDDSSSPSSARLKHRRKFSLGNGILNHIRKPTLDGTEFDDYDATVNTPVTPAPANVHSRSSSYHTESDNESMESLHDIRGGSDMILKNVPERNARQIDTVKEEETDDDDLGSINEGSTHRTPLKFEIHIVKVPLVGLYGVRFKKILGNAWIYKRLASKLLQELNL